MTLDAPFTERLEIRLRLQGTQILRFRQMVLGCQLLRSINPCINSIFNNRTEDTNHGVNVVYGSDSAFMRAAVQWRSNPQLETLQPLLLSRVPH